MTVELQNLYEYIWESYDNFDVYNIEDCHKLLLLIFNNTFELNNSSEEINEALGRLLAKANDQLSFSQGFNRDAPFDKQHPPRDNCFGVIEDGPCDLGINPEDFALYKRFMSGTSLELRGLRI